MEGTMVTNETNFVDEPKTKTYRLAGTWVRFYAYLIDVLTVGIFSSLFIYPLLNWMGLNHEFYWLHVQLATLGIFGVIYFIVLTSIWSQTLGKMILGLKVIRQDGRPLDWETILFREGIGRFISQLLGLHLGYIWAIFHPKKQTWHDQVADTYVVLEEHLTTKYLVQIEVQK